MTSGRVYSWRRVPKVAPVDSSHLTLEEFRPGRVRWFGGKRLSERFDSEDQEFTYIRIGVISCFTGLQWLTTAYNPLP